MNRLKIEIREIESMKWLKKIRRSIIHATTWFILWCDFHFDFFSNFFISIINLLFIWNHISRNVNWFIRSWHVNANIACKIIIITTTFYQTSVSENWNVYDQFIDKIEFRIYSFMTRIKHTIRKKRNKNKKYKFRKTTTTTTTTTTTDEEEKKMTNVKYTKQSKNVNW